MTADTMRLIAYVLYAAAAVFLAAAAFFFWKLKIPSVINDLNGKTARRDIAQSRQERQKKKEKTSSLYENSGKPKAAQMYTGANAVKAQPDLSAEGATSQITTAISDDDEDTATVSLEMNSRGDEDETLTMSDTQEEPTTRQTPPVQVRVPLRQTDEMETMTAPSNSSESDVEDEVLFMPTPTRGPVPRSSLMEETTSSLVTGTVLDPENMNSSGGELRTALLHPVEDEEDILTTALDTTPAPAPKSELVKINQVVLIHTDDVIPVESY